MSSGTRVSWSQGLSVKYDGSSRGTRGLGMNMLGYGCINRG